MRERLTAIAVLLVTVGAFSAGRFTAPLQVQTRDVEHVVYRDRVVERTVTVAAEAKTEQRVVYVDRVITKEGEIREHVVERTATKDDTVTQVDAAKVEVREVEKVVEHTTTVTLRPDWRVAVLAGASLKPPALPLAGPLVLGVEADRRIVGGLSAGLWVSTSGAAGAAVSFEF